MKYNARTFDGLVHEVRVVDGQGTVPCHTSAYGDPDKVTDDWNKISVFMTDEPVTCLECLSNVPQPRQT